MAVDGKGNTAQDEHHQPVVQADQAMATTTAEPLSASDVETLAAAVPSAKTLATQGDAASDAADSAAADIGEAEGGVDVDDVAVCITVYPPPQSGAGPLVLEPLAGVELVMQVRQLLGEIPQTCLFSAFQLVAVTPKGVGGVGGSVGGDGEEDLDVWKREGEVMNDYVELRSIDAVAAFPSKVEVRMELDAYTTHSARQHVHKFRELLRYPPPCADGLGPGAKPGSGKKSKGKGGGKNKKEKAAAKAAAAAASSDLAAAAAAAPVAAHPPPGAASSGDSTVGAASTPPAVAEADASAEDMARRVQRALDIRGRLKDSRVPVGDEGLGCFYGVGLGLAVQEVALPSKEEAAAAGKGDKDKDSPVSCLRGVSISAWNPPPPQRKMVGDLIYLEVTALDGTVIHITCSQGGFYVNGTRRDNFDPKPATNNPCHSHELATCLLACSPSFSKAWNTAATQAWRRTQADDPVHALARAMREGRGDAVMVKPQWNMPVPDPTWAGHKADPSRAQEDLSSGFGMEDRGVPREWNDEYQCLLELPNDTPDLSMTRSRALHKLLSDFQEAATAGALAINDGHIPAANPTEAEHSHVFVFNNIFFSYAADSPDAYKAVSGDAAARKSASQDLASVVALNLLAEALHPQLGIKTLATVVVDYCGKRLVAQSLVPGILNGDQTDKVVYGAMEHGQPLRQNDKMSGLLRKVGEKLMIAEREIDAVPIKKPSPASSSTSTDTGLAASSSNDQKKQDGEEDAAAVQGDAAGETVRVTGSVEMKGIVGSDGRSYLLDVSRLTPRDANWVREKGTRVYNDWMAARREKPLEAVGEWEEKGGEGGPDLSFEHMTVLRPELLTMFTRHKVTEWFRVRDSELRRAKQNALTPNEDGQDKKEEEEQEGEEDSPATATTLTPPEASPTTGVETPSPEEPREENGADDKPAVGVPDEAGGEQGEVPILTDDDKEEAVAPGAGVGVGGVGEGGQETALSLSNDEVAMLKEEQETRCRELAMNVNVFMPFKGCVDSDQLLADEALASDAATFLWEVALPFVTAEVKRGSLCPLDCAEMAHSLHATGVNVRYMGRLAGAAIAEETEDRAVRAEGKLRRWRMPLFWLEMLETEMVARAATHVYNRYMAAGSSRSRLAPGRAIQQFLNCLLGEEATPSKAQPTSNGPSSGSLAATSTVTATGAVKQDSSWISDGGGVVALTRDGLWASLSAEVAARFRHELVIWGRGATVEAFNANRAHKLPLLRRVCQRLGLRVLSKNYGFDTPEPFALEDIVGVFPVVKSCVPSSPAPDAAEALEMSQLHLSSGVGLQTAHEYAQHAAAMLLQTCDGMHSKYPAALNLQARVMYHMGDADAAVALQLKSLAYFEQLEGLDSSAVVKCHEYLGQYYMLAGLYDKALAHMRAYCYLVELTAGPNHPELANGYHRMGRAYQDVGSVMMALRCYQEALERQAGDHMLNPRVHHNVAETLEVIGGYTDALKHERLSHAGYKAVHGEEHPLVLKSTENIRALTTKIVKAAQVQKSVQAPPPSVTAATAGSGSSVPSANSDGRDSSKDNVERSTKQMTKSAPAAEPLPASVTGGGGGVEESKVNGPPSPTREVAGEAGKGSNSNSNSKSSKKKNRR